MTWTKIVTDGMEGMLIVWASLTIKFSSRASPWFLLCNFFLLFEWLKSGILFVSRQYQIGLKKF